MSDVEGSDGLSGSVPNYGRLGGYLAGGRVGGQYEQRELEDCTLTVSGDGPTEAEIIAIALKEIEDSPWGSANSTSCGGRCCGYKPFGTYLGR